MCIKIENRKLHERALEQDLMLLRMLNEFPRLIRKKQDGLFSRTVPEPVVALSFAQKKGGKKIIGNFFHFRMYSSSFGSRCFFMYLVYLLIMKKKWVSNNWHRILLYRVFRK